jgi:hypothetical protein
MQVDIERVFSCDKKLLRIGLAMQWLHILRRLRKQGK